MCICTLAVSLSLAGSSDTVSVASTRFILDDLQSQAMKSIQSTLPLAGLLCRMVQTCDVGQESRLRIKGRNGVDGLHQIGVLTRKESC